MHGNFKPIIQMYLILIACVIISPIGCLLIWEFLHYNMYSDIDFFPPSIVFQKVSVIKFYQMSLLDSNTCICGKKAIALRMSPFSKCLVYITTGPENLIIVVKRLKQKFNWNPLMRIRLIAEFHLVSSSLSSAINGRIIPKLMQKCFPIWHQEITSMKWNIFH